MNKPEPSIPEEMLSAYLDGELAHDEQQMVAGALEQSAELRSLLDELTQIRAELRNLPQYKLPEDFVARVVDSTRNDDEPTVALASNPAPQTSVVTKPANTSSNESRFRWIVGIAATAAAVLISFWAIGPNAIGPNVAQTNTAQPAKTEAAPGASLSKTDLTVRADTTAEPEAMPALHDQPRARSTMEQQVVDNALGAGGRSAEGRSAEGLGAGGLNDADVELSYTRSDEAEVMELDANVENFGFSPPQAASDIAVLQSSMDVKSSADAAFGQSPEVEKPFAAVVTLALTEDQLSLNQTGVQARYYELDDTQQLFESIAQSGNTGQVAEAKKNQANLYALFKGSGIPENAKLMVLEGTSKQLTSAFAELGTKPTAVSLLQPSVNPNLLGLPQPELLAATSKSLVQRRSQHNAVEATSADEVLSRTARESAAVKEPLSMQQLNRQTLGKAKKETQERYRVLLIVQPK